MKSLKGREVAENITLQQIRYFLAVAESGSYTPGGSVRRSQPAVSRGIRALERLIGRDLFRTEDRATLTPFGRELLDAASKVSGAVEALARLAADGGALETEPAGPLTIGAKQAFAASLLPRLLKAIRKKHPGLDVRVKSKDGAGLAKMLRKGEIEVAITHQRDGDEGFEFLPLYRVRRVVIAPAGHPVMKARSLTAEDLAAWPIILPESGGRTAREARQLLSSSTGKRLNIPIEVMGADARSRFVEDGWGIAITEEGRERALPRGLKSRPIPESILPSRIVGAAHAKDLYLSSAARIFLEVCRGHSFTLQHS